jgi:hypothetical protein
MAEKEKSALIWKAVLAISLASLTACSNLSTATYVKPEVPVSLTQPCPDLPDIPDRSEKSVAQWIVETVSLYYECAAKHERLVEVVK